MKNETPNIRFPEQVRVEIIKNEFVTLNVAVKIPYDSKELANDKDSNLRVCSLYFSVWFFGEMTYSTPAHSDALSIVAKE